MDTSDPYNWFDALHRQVFWAHLNRDFHAWVERGGKSAVIGQMLLARLKQFFGILHRVRDGTLSRVDFQTAMQPIRLEVVGLLEIGNLLDHREIRRICLNILKFQQAL